MAFLFGKSLIIFLSLEKQFKQMDKPLNLLNFLKLKGHKINLIKLDPEHAKDYHLEFINSSIESNALTGTKRIFSKQDLIKYLDNISTDKSRNDFLIYTNDTKEMVGEVVLNGIDAYNRTANLRVAIFQKEDFNRGYGTEAIILALNYGFGMRNLHRISLSVLNINERAYHVYEKIGFKKEGVSRDACFYNHRYYDMVEMSILEQEFKDLYLTDIESIDKLV